MPKQNRVTPFGELIANPARGTLMGNRGCLHDKDGMVMRRSARQQWVTCLLEFNGRQRQVMSPGQYTELFFLDEATAFAAGHRPCATCQRDRFKEFKSAWGRATVNSDVALSQIDDVLQSQRLASRGAGGMWRTKLADLPDGVMVVRVENPGSALLYWHGSLFPWTPSGYLGALAPIAGETVAVITPQAVCASFATGLLPKVHSSVQHPASSLHPNNLASMKSANQPVMKASALPPTAAVIPMSEEPQLAKQPALVCINSPQFRLTETPNGGRLFAYFAAVLEVTGMTKGATFPLQKFIGNFSTHITAGRIEKVGIGYRLTPAGMDYFADRFSAGNRQRVSRSEVDHWAAGIRNGGTGWTKL